MTNVSPVTESRAAGRKAIALFLAAPLLWAVHLGVSYVFVALDCTSAWTGGHLAIALATLLSAGAAAAAGVTGWRWWRRKGEELQEGQLLDPVRVQPFLALGGAVLSVPFTLLIVLAGISPLFVPMCR